jgi:hypothetical protein
MSLSGVMFGRPPGPRSQPTLRATSLPVDRNPESEWRRICFIPCVCAERKKLHGNGRARRSERSPHGKGLRLGPVPLSHLCRHVERAIRQQRRRMDADSRCPVAHDLVDHVRDVRRTRPDGGEPPGGPLLGTRRCTRRPGGSTPLPPRDPGADAGGRGCSARSRWRGWSHRWYCLP